MGKTVCFDVETTGVSSADELLQITVVDENCNILFESYIRPRERINWVNAEMINHISPSMVQDSPTALEVASKLKEIFDNADVIVGYNVNFDVGFVEKDCGISISRDKITDCMVKFKDECRKKNIMLAHHKLGDAVDFYCPEAKEEYLTNAHDASCDAIATMKVYTAQTDPKRQRYYEQVKSLSSAASSLLSSLLNNSQKEPEINEETEEDHER